VQSAEVAIKWISGNEVSVIAFSGGLQAMVSTIDVQNRSVIVAWFHHNEFKTK
jgi:hypothetical protein